MLTIKQCLPLLALLAHQVGAGDAREGETGLAGQGHPNLQQAVPVIHLTEDQYTGKASVDDYLKMFPNELLGKSIVMIRTSLTLLIFQLHYFRILIFEVFKKNGAYIRPLR